MSKWSQELQDNTRDNLFRGAVVKDEDHNFGIVTEMESRIVIKGINPDSIMPVPTDETIATFNSVLDMVEAGWVLD